MFRLGWLEIDELLTAIERTYLERLYPQAPASLYYCAACGETAFCQPDWIDHLPGCFAVELHTKLQLMLLELSDIPQGRLP
jgi:hypothetical protein